MATAIRPLTRQERQKPAHLCFHGGFRNVSFQIGEVSQLARTDPHVDFGVASYARAEIIKSPTIKFPIMIPNSLAMIRGVINTIATVVGQKNAGGGYDAVLLARATERLSSFNTKLRTVEHLIASKKTGEAEEVPQDDEATRLGKSSNARSHNQVMLAGIVVGARFEDGQYPRFHIFIRQDSDPNNIIPLCYEARNASSMVSRVKFGSIIYVEGEFVYRNVRVFQLDENGARRLDEDSKPIPEVDAQGEPVKRIQTYIRVTAPKDPAEFDLDFGNSIPAWMSSIAKQLTDARTRSPAAAKESTDGARKVSAPTAATPSASQAPKEDPRATTFAGIPASIDDL